MAQNIEHLILSSKRHLESIFDSITDSILIISPDLALERLNASAAGRVGGDYAAILGRKCFSAFHGRSTPCPECPYPKAYKGRKAGSVKMARMENNAVRIWDMRYFPFHDKAGRVTAVVEHYVDITEGEKAKRTLEASFSKIRQGLETARHIQKALLPSRKPRIPGLRVEAFYSPAEEVGGDLYDFIRVDRNTWGLVIADVSGHGVPASLIGAMARMALYTHIPGNLSSRDVLSRVNKDLYHNLVMEFYVSAAYYLYNAARRRLTWSRAGHPEGLLLHAVTGRVSALSGPGYFLGMMEDGGYGQASVDLRRGDRLFLYTDGVLESRALRSLLFETRRLPLEGVKKRVLRDMKKGERQGKDDATFILLEVAR